MFPVIAKVFYNVQETWFKHYIYKYTKTFSLICPVEVGLIRLFSLMAYQLLRAILYQIIFIY